MNKKENNDTALKGIGVIILYILWSAFTYEFIKLFGIDFNKLNKLLKQLYLIGYELVLTLLIIYIYRKDFIPDFFEFKKNFKNYIDKYLKYWFIMLGLMILSNIIVTQFTTTDVANNQSAIVDLLKNYPIYIILVTVITAPILEELIFRLSIRKIINNNLIFIIASGLFFGSLHVIGTLKNPIDLLFIIPYSIPGFIFAYVYTKSNNIWTTIGMHCMHNSIMILLQILI